MSKFDMSLALIQRLKARNAGLSPARWLRQLEEIRNLDEAQR